MAGGIVSYPAVRNDAPDPDDWAVVARLVGGIVIIGPILVTVVPPTVGVTTTIPAAVIPTVYLAANPARLGAVINNDSIGRFLYLKLGAGVGVASYAVRLGPHSYYEVPFPCYTGVIEGVWSAGVGGFATVTELV
jgi:hypothetical protein